MLEVILLLLGFALLTKSADWLIRGAETLAERYNLSQNFIGLTIVAIGTSAPELAVSLFSIEKGSEALSVGNILGSNLANLLLILGIVVLAKRIHVKKPTFNIGLPLNLLVSLLVALLVGGTYSITRTPHALTRLDGILLLCTLPLYLYFAFSVYRGENPEHQVTRRKLLMSYGSIAIGIIGLAISGDWIVISAKSIASTFNISEHLIGLTIVALGTNLPELATTITGLVRKKHDLVVGNLIGSSLFNMIFILGFTALLHDLPFDEHQFIDLVAVGLSSVLIFIIVLFSRDKILQRIHGFILVGVYAAYQAFRISQG
ncbi:MAG: calcium/sodium antiporter [Patescibacteria group bacterium]|nr:calcium/sodium antiporter [Patescibacteria group bacterium]